MDTLKRKKGFTIIELFLVVLLILVLVLILFFSIKYISYKVKKARAIDDLRSIMQACELYKMDWGHFPITGETSDLVSVTDTPFYQEITGKSDATVNNPNNYTRTGEQGGIDYFGAAGLSKVINPFAQNYQSPWNYELYTYRYGSLTGKNFVLQVYEWGWSKYLVVYHDTYTSIGMNGTPSMTYIGGKVYEVPDWYTVEIPP